MTAYRMRPRFVLHLSIPPQEAIALLQQQLTQHPNDLEGAFRKQHAQLSIHRKKRHFWSPFVSLELVPLPQSPDGSEVHGIIGPSPNVWTMFMAGHFALLFLGFMAASLGYSQWSVQQAPWGLYLLPFIAALSVFWYGLSALGQRLAANQIQELRQFLDEGLAQHILPELPPDAPP